MRILFVSSGNRKDVSIIVRNQGDSISSRGIEVKYFSIKGKGLLGYIRNIKSLKAQLKQQKYDLIHAHYSLSGFVATLAGAKPLVVSLMGSDTYSTFPYNRLIKLFHHYFWDVTIVKSQAMKNYLGLKDSYVIPNGVNIDLFKPISKVLARQEINFQKQKKLIVFVSDPKRAEKNFDLAKKSVALLSNEDIELMPVFNIPYNKMPFYINAADVLILTSNWEGSANVIKEAMACSIPIVSTDVGDTGRNISGLYGCYLTNNNPNEIAERISAALNFVGNTNGREKLISLGLDSQTIANKIIELYNSIIN